MSRTKPWNRSWKGWKNRVVGRLFRRAIIRREKAETEEQRQAWGEVIVWLGDVRYGRSE